MADYRDNNGLSDASLDELLDDANSYFEPPQSESLSRANQTVKVEADGFFEPDFGNAFDDYGEYNADAYDRQPAPAPGKRMRRKTHLKKFKFPALLKLAIYFAIVAALAVFLAKAGWAMADDVLALTRPDIDVEITINQTDTVEEIADTLKDAGAIKYDWLFKLYCKFTKSENYFDPGVYTVNLTSDYHALVNSLMAVTGSRETVTVMIIEGASCSDIFDLLEENNVCSRARLEQCAAEYHFDYDFLRRLPYGDANRLEGYLFPDTYEFYLMDEPEAVLDRFLKNFQSKYEDDILDMLEGSEYSLSEIITMASIIEGEAANDGERADVASVMYNRLNNWEFPTLGMDSTVYYGAKLLGTEFSLELDSPYNTYRYAGLPKGPINNPGMNSIRAALNPAETDYYYFATGVDGLNHFFHEEQDFLDFLNSEEFDGQ